MLNPVVFIVAVLTDFLTFLAVKREEPQVRYCSATPKQMGNRSGTQPLLIQNPQKIHPIYSKILERTATEFTIKV